MAYMDHSDQQSLRSYRPRPSPKNWNPLTWEPVIALASAVSDLNNWPSYSNPLLTISTRSAAPCILDEASSLEGEGAGPRQVATARPTLQVLVGSSHEGVSRGLRNRAPALPLGPWLAPKGHLRRWLGVAKRYVGSGSVCFGFGSSRRRAIRIARPLW